LILLIAVPILVAAPVYDSAIEYQMTASGLRTESLGQIQLQNQPPHYVADVMLSIIKHNFADTELFLNWTLSIGSMNESSPRFGIGFLDPTTDAWDTSTYSTYAMQNNSRNLCQGTSAERRCVEYGFGSGFSLASRTNREWSQFGALNAPMDKYQTLDYYFWLERSFAIQNVGLSYDLPPGYRAGVDVYSQRTLEGIPKGLLKDLPTGVDRIYSLRIIVMRDPSSFLPLVLYGTLPLIILYYVSVITFMTLDRREDRLKIFVGALFSSFAYFLSLRQLLQTPVSWIELLAMVGMVIWIGLEATTIAFQK